MKNTGVLAILFCAIFFVLVSVSFAQPTIPREKITSDIPSDVKQQIEKLYSSESSEQVQAILQLGALGEKAKDAVPFLKSMVQDVSAAGEDSPLRYIAAQALALTGKPGVDSLIEIFRDKNQDRNIDNSINSEIGQFYTSRSLAVYALPLAKDERVLQILLEAAKDEDSTVKRAAVISLGETKEYRAVGILAAVLLDSNDAQIQRESARALSKIGEPAVELLIGLLKNKDPYIRQLAAAQLGKIKDTRAIEPLAATLRDPDAKVRIEAGYALGFTGKPAVEVLIKALEDENPDVRAKAAEALRQTKDTRASTPLLIAALQDKDGGVRASAAFALSTTGDIKAIDGLIEVLKDPDINVCCNAIYSLGQLKNARAVKPLIGMLDSRAPEVRSAAADALGEIGDSLAVGPLVRLLKDTEGYVKRAAVVALGNIRNSKAVAPLIENFKDRDSRNDARDALVKIGKPAVEPLMLALKNKNLFVREYSASTLGAIGDKSAIKPLIEVLKTKRDSLSFVHIAAEDALARMGPPAIPELIPYLGSETGDVWVILNTIGEPAVKPLLEALKDKNPKVRIDSGYALANIVAARSPYGEEVEGEIFESIFDPLVLLLKDKDSEVRKKAPNILYIFMGKRSFACKQIIPLLVAALGEQEGKYAAVELSHILAYMKEKYILAYGLSSMEEEPMEPLFQALKDDNPVARRNAAFALGEINYESAIEPLKVLLKDENKDVRDTAYGALKKIRGGYYTEQ